MGDCIFCRIVKKEAPAHIIYEDEHIVAFLDINPLSEGHTLVIPKKHYTRVSEMSEEDLKNFIFGFHKVVKLIESKLAKDYNIIVNQGKTAEQEIDHLHFHIVPRYGNEMVFSWKTHKLTEEEAREVLNKLNS